MEKYKENMKIYSKVLKEESIILKLLDIGDYSSINMIKNIISKCNWEDTGKIVNIYDFQREEIIHKKNLFSSFVFLNTDLIINEIIVHEYFVELIINKNITNIDYGTDIFIDFNENKIQLGSIVDINNNKIIIKSEMNEYELSSIKNINLIIKINIYSTQNINKGVHIYLPIIRLNKDNWTYDCIIDKKSYENENKLCFNLLDDLNIANSCGIISIILIGIFLGRITFKNGNKHIKKDKDNIYLAEILNKIKKMKKLECVSNNQFTKNNSTDNNSTDNNSTDNNSTDNNSTDNNSTDNNSSDNNSTDNNSTDNNSTNSNTNKIYNKKQHNYLNKFSNEVMNSSILEEIKVIDTEIKNNKKLNNIYLHLNNLENILDENIEKHVEMFENVFQKIKLDESLDIEHQYLLSSKKIIEEDYNHDDIYNEKMKKNQYYINLLKNFE